jgi:hypothetical protein
MKIYVITYIIILALAVACTPAPTPLNLKEEDTAKARCAEACKPRKPNAYTDFFGAWQCECIR